MERGFVIKSTGSWFTVKSENGLLVNCKIKGTYRIKDIKSTNPVTVGDHVTFIVNDDNTGIIVSIDERKNYIIRRASNLSKQYQLLAANIDRAWIIASLKNPQTFLEFIDRFLVSAEAYRIPVSIIFNKIDLLDEFSLNELENLINQYEKIGYQCFKISATEKTNIIEIENLIYGKINLFAGNSGVGKSTLINTLDPSIDLRIGAISDYHKKGKHTTTFAQMFELSKGGYIIDTPGIKGFGIVDIDKVELFHFFPEIFQKSSECQFYNCKHTHEPGCAVKKAVETNHIMQSRYDSYMSLLMDDEERYR